MRSRIKYFVTAVILVGMLSPAANISAQVANNEIQKKSNMSEESAVEGPLERIKEFVEYMKMYKDESKIKLTDAEKKKNQEVLDKISSILDVPAMAKSALGTYINKVSSVKINKYVTLMQKLVEKIAYPASSEYFNEIIIQYKSVKKIDDTHALVDTVIIDEKEDFDIDITYKMFKSDTGWKIIDVITDGDSLVLNYKNQFTKIIKDKGFDHLISLMDRKLKK